MGIATSIVATFTILDFGLVILIYCRCRAQIQSMKKKNKDFTIIYLRNFQIESQQFLQLIQQETPLRYINFESRLSFCKFRRKCKIAAVNYCNFNRIALT